MRYHPGVSDVPIRLMLLINDDTEAAPPGGAMEIIDIDEDGYAHIERPTRSGLVKNILFNGSVAIPAKASNDDVGNTGAGNREFPTVAAYLSNDGTDPQIGEIWGTQAGSWYLHRCQNPGFLILGGAGEGMVNIEEALPRDFKGRITGVSEDTCGQSGSGTSTEHTVYRYTVHSVHAVLDGDGCEAWALDDADVATIEEEVTEQNNHLVSVGTIVDVEYVTSTDESQSGVGLTGPASCRAVFKHEEVDEPCLTPGTIFSQRLRCVNSYIVIDTYSTYIGFDDDGCYGPQPEVLTNSVTTTWCCDVCAGESGSGDTPCSDTPPDNLCVCFHDLDLEISDPALTDGLGSSPCFTVPFVNGEYRLKHYIDGVVRADIVGKIDPSDTCSILFWAILWDANHYCHWNVTAFGAQLDGNGNVSQSSTSGFLSGNCIVVQGVTVTITAGECTESGSGDPGNCPCTWKCIGAGWTLLSGGVGCVNPPGGTLVCATENAIAYTNEDGTTCDSDAGPSCDSCGSTQAAVTVSGGTGFLSSMANTTLTTDGMPANTFGEARPGQTYCSQQSRLLIWCMGGNRWFCGLEGTGVVSVEAVAGSTCANMVFQLNYGTDNLLCPGQSGTATIIAVIT